MSTFNIIMEDTSTSTTSTTTVPPCSSCGCQWSWDTELGWILEIPCSDCVGEFPYLCEECGCDEPASPGETQGEERLTQCYTTTTSSTTSTTTQPDPCSPCACWWLWTVENGWTLESSCASCVGDQFYECPGCNCDQPTQRGEYDGDRSLTQCYTATTTTLPDEGPCSQCGCRWTWDVDRGWLLDVPCELNYPVGCVDCLCDPPTYTGAFPGVREVTICRGRPTTSTTTTTTTTTTTSTTSTTTEEPTTSSTSSTSTTSRTTCSGYPPCEGFEPDPNPGPCMQGYQCSCVDGEWWWATCDPRVAECGETPLKYIRCHEEDAGAQVYWPCPDCVPTTSSSSTSSTSTTSTTSEEPTSSTSSTSTTSTTTEEPTTTSTTTTTTTTECESELFPCDGLEHGVCLDPCQISTICLCVDGFFWWYACWGFSEECLQANPDIDEHIFTCTPEEVGKYKCWQCPDCTTSTTTTTTTTEEPTSSSSSSTTTTTTTEEPTSSSSSSSTSTTSTTTSICQYQGCHCSWHWIDPDWQLVSDCISGSGCQETGCIYCDEPTSHVEGQDYVDTPCYQ